MKKVMMLTVALVLFLANSSLGGSSPVENEINAALGDFTVGCQKELVTYCQDVTPGNKRVLACLYAYGDKLSNGSYGVKEPLKNDCYFPDIIFIPCLAFDKQGFRLGYGGGFYDKTISYLKAIKHNFLTIGFAYDDQKVSNVVHDGLDQKLNYILTEKQLYEIL